MSEKKWPVFGQILIALGCIGSVIGVAGGIIQRNIAVLIFSLAAALIYWNVYKFKGWAKIGLNIFLSLNILFNLLAFFVQKGVNLVFIISMCMPILFLFYFNSGQIRRLFK
jgi:hypothetical protein